jgi:hypothetical protein
MAEVKKVICITMPGLCSQWLVNQNQTVETKHGTFVCIDPLNAGLRNIVTEENPLIPSLTNIRKMKGYALLRQMRNEAEPTAGSESAPSCTLFDDCADTPPTTPKNKYKTRVAGDEPDYLELKMTIDDSSYTVFALSGQHPREKVFVEATSHNISQAITVLRNSGMGGGLNIARDQTLPRGIWQRGLRYMVHKRTSKKKYKIVGSLEEAQEFLAEDSADDGECEESS